MSSYIRSMIARAESSASMSAYPQSSGAATGGSATGTAAGGGGGFSGGSPDKLISVWVDYSALIVVAFFMLVALPRFLARLGSNGTSGWTSGLLLYKASIPSYLKPTGVGTNNARSARLYRQPTNTTLRGDIEADSSQSHTLAAHGYGYGQSYEFNKHPAHSSSSAVHLTGTTSPSVHAPVHLRSPSSLLHPISSLFTYSYAPGKSIGGALLTLACVVGLLIAVFINGGDPLVDPERTGWISIALVPIVVALGTKNNLVGLLVGVGYERVRSVLLYPELLWLSLIFVPYS